MVPVSKATEKAVEDALRGVGVLSASVTSAKRA
jgi:hypothetical protein